MEKAVERTKALLSNWCCDELKAQGVAKLRLYGLHFSICGIRAER